MRNGLATHPNLSNLQVITMTKTATLSTLLACFCSFLLVGCTLSTSAMEEEEVAPPPPPAFNFILKTDDPDDRVEVSSATRDLNGQVEVCLNVETESGWWKGLGIDKKDPSIEAKKRDGITCSITSPRSIEFYFWKAGFLGIHKRVGEHVLNLAAYGDHRVTFEWKQD